MNNSLIPQSILNIVQHNKIPHAILLEGSNALSAANFIAKAVVCLSGTTPCNECSACKKAIDNNHADIIYLTPEKSGNPYKIDFIREIRADSYIMPNEAKKKVYIFTDVDKISVQAQNGLLKIIEEPPETVIFIFCCTKKSQLLDTIISRVSYFNCSGKNEASSDDENKIKSVEILNTAANMSEYELIKLLTPFSKDRQLFQDLLNEFLMICRNVYLIKLGVDSVNDCSEDLISFSEQITIKKAMSLVEVTENTINDLSHNANAVLSVTRFCAMIKSALGG